MTKMRSFYRFAIVLGCLAVAPIDARGATLCVNPGGTGGCFASIQAAVDAAVSRDRIEIGAGTYVGGVSIPARKGTITIDGAGAGLTVLDGQNPNLHVLSVRGGGTRPTISNLTLTGGRIGAFVHVPAQATFVDVEFTGNEVGLENQGKTTVLRSNAVANSDCGLRAWYQGSSLTLTDSTVSGNGQYGVRIASDSKAKIVSSTISGNGGFGVGVGAATVESSTITNNSIGGIAVFRRTTLRSTIVSGNGALGGDCQTTQVGAPLRVLGTSMIGEVGSCTVVAAAGLLLTGDPLLGPLQNNGGTTETHALLPGSPAIGVLTRGPLCKHPDQRGVARSTPCDLGAFEAP
ncbi:right-handed parallel beta-helix repeat-containing protein [Candidatus Binatia bacterium]|nr:right-handed parallel beta-helix repeat-containing protein [Candidatus Binatia bacterium]